MLVHQRIVFCHIKSHQKNYQSAHLKRNLVAKIRQRNFSAAFQLEIESVSQALSKKKTGQHHLRIENNNLVSDLLASLNKSGIHIAILRKLLLPQLQDTIKKEPSKKYF